METSGELNNAVLSTYFDPERVGKCHLETKCPVVTVSRAFGANASVIAELLADSLTVPCFDYALVDRIAKELKTDKQLVRLIDEKSPKPMDKWHYSSVTKGVCSRVGYYRLVVKAILAIAEGGGVIVGRGAHLVLAHHPRVFRVRIDGSLDVRSKRVAEREKISLRAAREMAIRVDEERKRYLKEIHKIHPTQRIDYDLLINSDEIGPHTAVEIIVSVMEKMGYYVPGSTTIEQAGTTPPPR
ncbi:MAG: cytidylate kinase-like family protein [Magnetococcus sp. XQGC-1]